MDFLDFAHWFIMSILSMCVSEHVDKHKLAVKLRIILGLLDTLVAVLMCIMIQPYYFCGEEVHLKIRNINKQKCIFLGECQHYKQEKWCCETKFILGSVLFLDIKNSLEAFFVNILVFGSHHVICLLILICGSCCCKINSYYISFIWKLLDGCFDTLLFLCVVSNALSLNGIKGKDQYTFEPQQWVLIIIGTSSVLLNTVELWLYVRSYRKHSDINDRNRRYLDMCCQCLSGTFLCIISLLLLLAIASGTVSQC